MVLCVESPNVLEGTLYTMLYFTRIFVVKIIRQVRLQTANDTKLLGVIKNSTNDLSHVFHASTSFSPSIVLSSVSESVGTPPPIGGLGVHPVLLWCLAYVVVLT